MTTLKTRIARAREVGARAVAVEIDVLAAKDAEIARLHTILEDVRPYIAIWADGSYALSILNRIDACLPGSQP